MKEYIFSIPTPIFVSVLVVSAIAIVIIAVRGHLALKFGNKTIDIGGVHEEKKEDTDIPPSTVMITERKRSCGDCVLLLMTEREKLEFKIRQKTNKIMKTQMTFVEQKLIEIQAYTLDAITKTFNKSSQIDDAVQYKLIYGLLKDALHKIKDEIRRSFKDNGFWDMEVSEFSSYLKDRTQVLYSMFIHYIRNMYPDKEGLLSSNEIINIIESKNNFLANLINDMYMFSRDVKIQTDKEIKQVQQDFSEWIDKFIN